jgi:hypothetical protein
MKHLFLSSALALFLATAAHAAEVTLAFDPLTVKAGEEMRITLFNPSNEAIELRVFAYNAVEATYDEGPKIVLPAGKLRFFDFKAPKEFVGLGGIIETVPDPAPKPEAKPGAPRGIMLTDVLVSSIKSTGSLQHRSATGSQTMGYSFGATQTGTGWAVRTAAKSARHVTHTNWVGSPEF